MKTYISINQGCEYPYASRILHDKSFPKWKNSKYKMKTMIKIQKSKKYTQINIILRRHETKVQIIVFSIRTKYVLNRFVLIFLETKLSKLNRSMFTILF